MRPTTGRATSRCGRSRCWWWPFLRWQERQFTSTSSNVDRYWHADWQGSVRFASTAGRTLYYDGGIAPYGEHYVETGSTTGIFGGMIQDAVAGMYDTPFREYETASGSWLSPDPASLAAVDLANPQSLNRYAYVMNNPTTFTDPLGLGPCDKDTKKPACGGDAVHSGPPPATFGLDEFDLAQLGFLPGSGLPSGICPAQYSSCLLLTNGQILGITGAHNGELFTFGTIASNGPFEGPCTSYAQEVFGCTMTGIQVVGQIAWNPLGLTIGSAAPAPSRTQSGANTQKPSYCLGSA
jgi:RHS repeat-associated protein